MRTILILGLVSLFTDISSEMVYPLIPLYLTSTLGATPAVVGIIEGIAESLASILKVFSGYISDRFQKRKPLAIAGYGGAAVGKIVLFFSKSWGGVLLGRVVDRFGKGVRTAPRDTLIADAASEKEYGKAFGLHRSMDSFGAVLGIILAYIFFTSGVKRFETIFLLAVIPAAIGVALLFFVHDKPKEHREPKPLNLRWSVLDRKLQLFLIIVFLFTLGNSSNQFLILRASDLGFTPAEAILAYLVFNVVYTLGSYPLGKLSDRVGKKKLLVSGYLFYGLVYLGFALLSAKWTVWLLFGFYGLYYAMTQGVEKALIAQIAPKDQRGTLMGLHATLTGIGLLPASLIAGFLWSTFGPAIPFYFGGIAGTLAAIGLWLFI